jgi:hypothetical protein
VSVVAEKQSKSAGTPRRAVMRAMAAWSHAPASELRALRAIVGVPRLRTKAVTGPGGGESCVRNALPSQPDAIRRACEECRDELKPALREAQPQRAITVGPADDEDERAAGAASEQLMGALEHDEDDEPPQVQRQQDEGLEQEIQRRDLPGKSPGSSHDEIRTAVSAAPASVGVSDASGAVQAVHRVCTECTQELQKSPLEEPDEEHVHREFEPPTFGDAGADDEDAVRRLLAPRPQFKIEVGPADDEHEREADAVAERVTRMSTPEDEDELPAAEAQAGQRMFRSLDEEEEPEGLQRQEREEEPSEEEDAAPLQRATLPSEDEEPEKTVRSKRRIGRQGGAIDDADLTARLRTPGSGRPLSGPLRSFIEPRLPYDFSEVRVHDTAEDRQDAVRLNARAFTYGRHIWIGPGESADNPRLMAHELTHVVQQGGASRLVQRDETDEAEEPGFIARMALDLVRRYAPGLEPILRRGPLNWLKDRLAGVFDGLVGTFNRLNPRAALDAMAGLFDALLQRAEPIVTALRSGNCEPLFQAIGELKDFVTEVAGAAWDGLVDFLRPVGDFFTNLWSGYGAPALEWLQNFADDLWDSIRQLGSDIWAWTAPVRDAIGGAWTWVKEQLFGPEDESSGESSGGIVSWITRKATEAWDWVKEQTRPVWEPVAAAAEEIRALIPPAFIRRLGEQCRQLSANLNQANEEMDGGDDIAENRAALAAALPTVQQVIAGVREILVGAGAWLLEKVDTVSGTLTGLLGRLRGHSLLRPLGTLLGWLETAAQRLGAWAHEKVAGLFNWVLRAFDFLTPFVQRLVTTVRNVIGVVGDLLQLPALILNTVWNLIPACIRDPIKDFLVNQILRRIPVFSTLLEIPDIWSRIEATALRILRQVFVDGNLAGAAWTFFRAILNVLGIPPQLVVGILAKAASAIGDILSDPVSFLLNLLSAIKEGFIRFFDNIGTHLLNGVTGWLFGHLSRAGIQPPADFSIGAVFGFVLQVLDITLDRVFERLARRIDPVIVQRLRRALEFATGAWRFIAILIEEGPAGLWREVQEQLGNLWNRVLDGVIGWVTRTVITRVSARLLTMLDPSGVMAVVNSAIALYRAIQSAIEYLREMLMIVDRVLDGINGIATGAIDIAAGFLETALASGVPVAIGFLANQIGLRDFGERIQEMVEAVRAQVDRAIDWLIDRAIAGGQALLNMLRRGVAAVRNWWAARKPFTSDEGEAHTLYFEGSGASARLMIQSDPQNYRDFIASVVVPPEKQAAKTEALGIAGELDQAVARAGSAGTSGAPAAAGAGAPASGGTAAPADPSADINLLLDRLATATAHFMPRIGGSTAPVYGPLADGFGTSVRVERLAEPCPGGGSPSIEGPDWLALRRRYTGEGTTYIRGHLLNNHLGGPGNTWTNLTPLSRSANSSMSAGFEEPVKTKVLTDRRPVHFVVTANYGRTHPLSGRVGELDQSENPDDRVIADIIRVEQKIPQTIQCEADILPGNGQAERIAPTPFQIVIDAANPDHYQLGPAPIQPFYVDTEAQAGNSAGLQQLGMTPQIAQAVISGRPASGYRRSAQLVEKGVDWDNAVRTPGLRVRIYRRS